MAGMAIMLDLRLAGLLIRHRLRAVLRPDVVQCGEVALFMLQPVGRGGEAGACCQYVSDKNREQQSHDPESAQLKSGGERNHDARHFNTGSGRPNADRQTFVRQCFLRPW